MLQYNRYFQAPVAPTVSLSTVPSSTVSTPTVAQPTVPAPAVSVHTAPAPTVYTPTVPDPSAAADTVDAEIQAHLDSLDEERKVRLFAYIDFIIFVRAAMRPLID